MKRRQYHQFSYVPYIDFLMSMLTIFVGLYVLVMMNRAPTTAQEGVKLSAEIVMNMTWPGEALDDIDLWMRLPDGRRVSYQNKDLAIATLDRDDRGGWGDVYVDPSGADSGSTTKLIKVNKETLTIRANVPGHYVVAAHVFAVYSKIDVYENEKPLPYEARLEVIKLNPRVVTIADVKVNLTSFRQQVAFISFDLAADGTVTNIQLTPDEVVFETGN